MPNTNGKKVLDFYSDEIIFRWQIMSCEQLLREAPSKARSKMLAADLKGQQSAPESRLVFLNYLRIYVVYII